MNLARVCIKKPVLAVMLNLVFIFLGIISYRNLTVDLFPMIDLPFVTVTCLWRGAGPKEVESQVTEVIEDAVAAIGGIETITSDSMDSISVIRIEFDFGTDVDFAKMDVKDKIDAILAKLPEDADPPVVSKIDINAIPLMELVVTSDRPLRETYELADGRIREALSRVSGVASVNISGGEEREIQVNLSKEKLDGYGLSIMSVVQAVGAENLSSPSGRITQSEDEFSIRVEGKYKSVSELGAQTVFLPNGGKVKLSELGSVDDTSAEKRKKVRYDGKEGISLSIVKLSDSQPIELARDVRKEVKELEAALPGINIEIIQDDSGIILDSVNDVITNIIIGIILTSIFLFLFLHSVRMTLIVAIVMPACIVSSFLLMDMSGFTLNILSTLGLGLSIGTLVINSIVILENITRRLDEGDSPEIAAEKGTSEVMMTVIAAAMTNIFVFTPIAFMSGMIGPIFVQFGLTVAFATLFSLWMSFTLTPMLAARILKPREEDKPKAAPFRLWDRGMGRLERGYATILRWSLNHLWVNVVAAVILVCTAVFFMRFLGGDFFPQSDQDYITINVELLAGTTLEKTDRTVVEIENIIKQAGEIDNILTTVGQGPQSDEGVEFAQLLVLLTKGHKKHIVDVNNELRNLLSGKFPGVKFQNIPASMGPGGGAGYADVTIEILGDEREELIRITNEVKDIVDNMPELVETSSSIKMGKPEITFYPSRNRLEDYGVTVAEVSQVLAASLTGLVASTYEEGNEEYDIRVQLAREDLSIAEDAERILIQTRKGLVPLATLGEVAFTQGETKITRKDKQHMFTVEANILQGSLTEIVNEIKAKASQINLPPGYSINMGGTAETQAETMAAIVVALVQAIFLTYMLIAAILGSYLHPFTIMLTIPFGFLGAILAMLIFGLTINIFSMLAMIMLVGIVVNDAILMLDLTSVYRRQGYSIKAALLKACPMRLRTIIMTNSTIIISMFPQTLGRQGAAIMRASLSIVEIGAIFVQTTCTLTVIPVLYVILDHLSKAKYAEENGPEEIDMEEEIEETDTDPTPSA